MFMYKQFEEKLSEISREKFGKSLKALDKDEVYSVIGELVKEKCDFTVSIPMYGKVNSMNVSCAAAILFAETAKQRHKS